jgi:hypothetical protein
VAKKKKKKLAAAFAVPPSALQLAQVLNPAAPATAPSLLTQPGADVEPGDAIGVGGAGAAAVPPEEGSFLREFWPVLAAMAAGVAGYVWWDLGIWWSIGIAFGLYVALRVGLTFLGG